MPYLTRRALAGLRDYKYKAGGYTILDAWHNPIWNWIVDHLPMWLAPNLITLMGLAALCGSYVLAAAHLPELDGEAPRHVYWACAAACFFYLHMDCLDGKQARRTGTSSPLGQLFDHGCDALAVVVITATLTTSFNLGHGLRPAGGCLIIMVPWIMAHWEEYHTGEMVYGNGMWGVTEANYLVVLLHAWTAWMGPAFWRIQPLQHSGLLLNAMRLQGSLEGSPTVLMETLMTKASSCGACAFLSSLLSHLPGVALRALRATQWNDVVLAAVGSLGALMLLEQIVRTGRTMADPRRLAKSMPPPERGDKTLGFLPALGHLAQLAAFFALAWRCIQADRSEAGHLRLRYVAVGGAYALQATRLIVTHMAKQPFVMAAWPFGALALLPLNAALAWRLDPDLLALAVALVVSAGYLHCVVGMVREICDFLDINALTIKRKKA
ncbi:hypothetical protein H632_c352p0 [Helicosporidium sp. ATCC 50920]|nr:hypothetical protein H632_c352p0 [Helicosporidium sp. ATCC 50920]|eukprot:KDD76107.1 hypothetical protein H632_c352p0 [Helicosporidium sp. ATCC 50920]